jgi:hypothetical protein
VIRKLVTALFVGAALVLACSDMRGAIIDEETWADGTVPPWTSTNSPGRNAAPYGTLNASAGWLQISGGSGQEALKEDYIYTSTDLIGNYRPYLGGTNVYSVFFDFYASNGIPDNLSLYFRSGTNTWYYDISTIYGGWWNYGVYLNQAEGWYGSSSTFLTDLNAVDEIGIVLLYQWNTGGQVYGLDDFQLSDYIPVPEPGTWTVLGFALTSLAMTARRFRRKRDKR